jgi:outer membrane biosynthesis protein TonB
MKIQMTFNTPPAVYCAMLREIANSLHLSVKARNTAAFESALYAQSKRDPVFSRFFTQTRQLELEHEHELEGGETTIDEADKDDEPPHLVDDENDVAEEEPKADEEAEQEEDENDKTKTEEEQEEEKTPEEDEDDKTKPEAEPEAETDEDEKDEDENDKATPEAETEAEPDEDENEEQDEKLEQDKDEKASVFTRSAMLWARSPPTRAHEHAEMCADVYAPTDDASCRAFFEMADGVAVIPPDDIDLLIRNVITNKHINIGTREQLRNLILEQQLVDAADRARVSDAD